MNIMPRKPIRILLFSSLFPHSGEPTLGIFVENRLRKLLEYEDIEATVIAPVPWFPFTGKVFGAYGRAARAKKKEIRHGISIYHPRYLVIPKFGMSLTPHFLFRAALKTIRKILATGNNFHVIDAHYLYPDGVAAARLGTLLHKPVIMTARGSDVTQIGLLKGPHKKIVAALHSVSHTITVSESLKRSLIAMGGDAENITTLRNGVDLDFFHERNRLSVRKSWGEKPTLLFAGWLIPRKRIDLVLEVTYRIPELHTVIVGDGPLRAEMARLACKLKIEGRVSFLGQVTPERMPEMYSAADVLLLPSDREGWANVLLESMACGTPVVTRAVGGAPDLVTSPAAGRLVDSEDAGDLASAVLALLKNRPGRAETRLFAERFDWHETSRGQKEIFGNAISDYASPDSYLMDYLDDNSKI